MKKKDNIEMLDDMFNEIAENAKSLELDDLSNADTKMKSWLNSPDSEMSPKQFLNNIIVNATGHNYTGSLEYEPKLPELMLCSASLKACPFPLEGIYNKKDTKIDVIYIYGHPKDTDNKCNSRIDKDFIWKILDDFKTPFKTIILTGAFSNIPEMRSIIYELYTKMSEKTHESHIEVTINSRVKDDNNKERTIVDLIHEGYIKPSILDNPNIVRLKYDTLSPAYYAQLFKEELKSKGSDLFSIDDNEDNNFSFNNDAIFI